MRIFAMRLDAAALTLSILWAVPMTAQPAPDSAGNDTASVRHVFLTRTVTSFVGWFPGALLGGAIGAAAPHRACGCDDPGLNEILLGIVVGGAVGSAVGAAAPNLNSRCSFGHRFGLGLLGSVVGTAVGIIPITEGAQAITVPVLSIFGAALAESRC